MLALEKSAELDTGSGSMLTIAVDELVAPRFVETGVQPVAAIIGRDLRGKLVNGRDQRIDAPRHVMILPQAVAEAQLVQAILDRGKIARQAGAQRI